MTEPASGSPPVVYSIGHSNHSLERFLDLLRAHSVEVLVDVRSEPYSKYSPHFDRKALEQAVPGVGLRYLFLGQELGGRPKGEEYYDGETVLYARVAQTALFQEGLARLRRGCRQYRIALMCSEEDPSRCHRYRLVAHELRKLGVL